MRDSLNNNPMVQAVAVGLLALIVGFLLFTRVVNRPAPGDAAPATDPAAATSAEPAAAGTAAPETGPAPATTTPSDATAPAPDAGAAPATGTDPAAADAAVEAAAAGEFVAGPGLPAAVVKAHADGKVVALLIVHEKGIEDREVEALVERLRSRGDTEVIVVPAPRIAQYSRITQGVNVDRTPALVVIGPRRLSEDGVPVASVSYGFRGPKSVEQAVEDGLYKGRKDLPYYPE